MAHNLLSLCPKQDSSEVPITAFGSSNRCLPLLLSLAPGRGPLNHSLNEGQRDVQGHNHLPGFYYPFGSASHLHVSSRLGWGERFSSSLYFTSKLSLKPPVDGSQTLGNPGTCFRANPKSTGTERGVSSPTGSVLFTSVWCLCFLFALETVKHLRLRQSD